MDAGVLRFPVFIFIFIFIFWYSSHTSIAHKPPLSIDIKQNTKLLQETSRSIAQRDASNPGNIPVFNPIPTTPNANPTFPQPPNPDFQQPPNPDFQAPPNPLEQQPPFPDFQAPPSPTTFQQPPATTNPIPSGANTPASSGGGGGSWCIANPTASQTALQVALDYACGYGGADCSAIQPGGPCHDPDTVKDHASYAFNNYYQKNPLPTSCVFGGTAQLSYTDPSTGNCHYASSSSSSPRTTTTTPPATPTPTFPMTPPSTTTPINPFSPTGPTGYGTQPTDYGAEPTGSPNSADIASSKLAFPILVTSCLILWLVGGKSK